MRKNSYATVFIVAATIIAVITMMVVDNNAPLHIEALRLSSFGKAWSTFVLPGALLFLLSVGMIASLICSLGIGSCAGIMDGGPVDSYIFFFISILVGLLYAFILLLGLRWISSRITRQN